MKTLNVTAALLAASLSLSTLALAEDQPQTQEVELEADAVDGARIEVDAGSQPVTIMLRIEDARSKPKRKPFRLPEVSLSSPHRALSIARRDRPVVFTVDVNQQAIGGLHSEAGSRGLAMGWALRLASDRHFWVAEVGSGSVGPTPSFGVARLSSTPQWRHSGQASYARVGLNLPLYRGVRSDTRLQPTLGGRVYRGDVSRAAGCVSRWFWSSQPPDCWEAGRESVSHDNLTGSLRLERTQWFSPKFGITFGTTLGFVQVPGRRENETELGISIGATL